MTWTDPTTRSTGDLITAAIWNQDVVDNLADLDDRLTTLSSGLVTEYQDTRRTAVTNSSAEETLVSAALAANFFYDGTNWNNLLRYRYAITYDNNDGGAPTLTVKMKLGSTTVLTPVSAVANSNELRLRVEGEVWATAQSVQRWNGNYRYGVNLSTPTYVPSGNSDYNTTSAEDGSGALNFIITVQMSAASANQTVYLEYLHLVGPSVLNV